jgi:carboxyl-terminal processing protease
MRKILSLILLHAIAFPVFSQTELLSYQEKWIKELVDKSHVSPRAIDDKFSADFFITYLDILDDGRLFFTSADLKKLESFRTTIDDEWNNGGTAFFTASSQLYKTKLLAAKTTVTEICAKPFDFSLPDAFNYSDTSSAATDKALYARWVTILKSEVLQSLMNIALNQWQTKTAIVKAEVMAKEAEVRARIKTKYLNRINGFLQNDEEYLRQMSATYLNTFLLCLDPHSAFFDAAARQNFKASVNSEGLSFGFALDENERGESYISRIAPGSAAWMSGLLNKGDIPVQLKWEGNAAVELAGLEREDIHELLMQHTTKKMELTVRKGNGQQQTVVLQKQKFENEDNIVKSFVLGGKQNIGYIMLPSFYTEWEDRSGSRCGADVAREIVKLKKDTIAGLILDLRFNGGGSLSEALEMAGIFVDEGVISQVKAKDGKVEAMKDMNRGVIYNGPLLVLINGQSASASEMVAAALQDYNRAIIAGTPSYGKATGQQIFPLQAGSEQSGFAKLTELKLYRPTGKTAQKNGVKPDVLIPDVYGIEETEADELFPLNADTIAAYKYFKPMKPLQFTSLQGKSNARVAEASKFNEAKRLSQLAASKKGTGKFSLKWDDAEKTVKAYAAGDREKIFSQPTLLYKVRNNTADQKFNAVFNTSDINGFWLKRLSADMYVEEAFQILSDFIQLQ